MNRTEKAFETACEIYREHRVDPEKAIILGDSLSSDILGGINAGIATCWFNPLKKSGSPAIIPDYEIETLAEFVPLLQSIQ